MSVPDFYFLWKYSDVEVNGPDTDAGYSFPISFSSEITDPVTFTLTTSALANKMYETASGISFYLGGDPDDVATVLGWSELTPSGGLEISFDWGATWTRFSTTVGNPAIPSTWIPLPALAMGLSGVAGQLSPFDNATVALRFNIPASNTVTGQLNLELAINCNDIN